MEKIEYMVEIPERIKNKLAYAAKEVLDNNYTDYKIVDIPFSEMLEDEIVGLRSVKSKR